MAYRHSLTLLTLGGLLLLALACGGSGSNQSAAPVTAPVDITLDFDSVDTGISKARLSGAEAVSGNIEMIPQNGLAPLTFSFSSSQFSVDVAPGDYEVIATNSENRQLRSYLPSVAVSTSGNATTELSLMSTTAAIVKDRENADIRSFGNIMLEVQQADSTLTSYLSSANQLGQALVYNYIKSWTKDQILAGNVTQSTVSALKTSFINENIPLKGAELFQHLSGNTIYWMGDSYTDPASITIESFDSTDLPEITFPVTTTGEKIVVAEVASDYSSSAVTVFDVATGNIQFNNGQTYDISDVTMAGHGRHIYVIGRSGADFIEKRDVDNVGVNIYGVPYSTIDDGEGSQNPHDLIFSSEDSALLLRYDSAIQWVVDPSVTSADAFKKSAIDLSAYDTADSIPECTQGVAIGDNTYVIAQRLDRNNGWTASANGYMIVLDAEYNEVDTGKAASGSGLLGIELPGTNPFKTVVHGGNIYVACRGDYGSSWSNTDRIFRGGIITINPDSFETELLIDDDAGVDASTSILTGGGTYGGLINGLEIVSDDKGYFSVYSAWGSSNLHAFNPRTGVVGESIPALENKDLRDFVADSNGKLWIASSEGIIIMDTATDTIDKTVTLDLVPNTLERIAY